MHRFGSIGRALNKTERRKDEESFSCFPPIRILVLRQLRIPKNIFPLSFENSRKFSDEFESSIESIHFHKLYRDFRNSFVLPRMKKSQRTSTSSKWCAFYNFYRHSFSIAAILFIDTFRWKCFSFWNLIHFYLPHILCSSFSSRRRRSRRSIFSTSSFRSLAVYFHSTNLDLIRSAIRQDNKIK